MADVNTRAPAPDTQVPGCTNLAVTLAYENGDPVTFENNAH